MVSLSTMASPYMLTSIMLCQWKSFVNNTGLHWWSCQLMWLQANRRQTAPCCCVKQATWTGLLGHKDTSLNLLLTVWSDTMTPVTLLRSCCSSLAVVERHRNTYIVRYCSSCGVDMHPWPCPTLLVNWPVPSWQFHKWWITDRETLKSRATQWKVHPS